MPARQMSRELSLAPRRLRRSRVCGNKGNGQLTLRARRWSAGPSSAATFQLSSRTRLQEHRRRPERAHGPPAGAVVRIRADDAALHPAAGRDLRRLGAAGPSRALLPPGTTAQPEAPRPQPARGAQGEKGGWPARPPCPVAVVDAAGEPAPRPEALFQARWAPRGATLVGPRVQEPRLEAERPLTPATSRREHGRAVERPEGAAEDGAEDAASAR